MVQILWSEVRDLKMHRSIALDVIVPQLNALPARILYLGLKRLVVASIIRHCQNVYFQSSDTLVHRGSPIFPVNEREDGPQKM
jgi:hypothetical protein